MLKVKEYVRAENLKQAYELNQKKTNRIIGGMLWMKMSKARIQTAIDLSDLGLDQIEENEEEFRIGCMVTLRQIELHEGLNAFSHGIIRESVNPIVGVQFRNLATVGGSIFGRFGFSDVLTCFLALDTYVELYKGGVLPLSRFAEMEKDNDILVRLIVKKTSGIHAYLSHRNTKTDFPVLAVAVSADANGARVVAGARPEKAVCVPMKEEWALAIQSGSCTEEDAERVAEELAQQISTGSNMRASAEYRSHLAKVLIKRGILELLEERGHH
ncbi:MAG: FAD binding domain-containing protein [Bariatricus sp.]|nr:FAD binding domain-containing protein [Bariatricus sp.]